MKKRYLGLARVSSREQEREGFSLDVQEDALRRYVERQDGELVKLYRIAETASKRDERKTFKELLAHAKRDAKSLDAVLFYKVDRAARNIFDYVELERLEADHELSVIYVAQPTENSPAGRMQRRILANMASFYTEQQSLDVREGHARRVKNGLFVGLAPYGYQNVRIDGRSVVEVDAERARTVRRIFDLYAHHHHTLDSLGEQLEREGHIWKDSRPRFLRSKLYDILRDRAYLGDVRYSGQWYAGTHEPLIDRNTFDRVQVLLGGKTYAAHESVYGSGLMTCAHCGRPVVYEVKTKQTKQGPREYRYYRCSRYTAMGHPRIRVREASLDDQVLALFARIKVQDEKIRDWIADVLRARTRDTQRQRKDQVAELQRQLATVKEQCDRLLNMRLLGEIEADTFASKSTELRDRESRLALEIEASGRQRSEHADLAVKAFELSQALAEKWLAAGIDEKRQLLEIICLNLQMDGENLVPDIRKPFDILAEGFTSMNTRGDWIRTCDLLLPKQAL